MIGPTITAANGSGIKTVVMHGGHRILVTSTDTATVVAIEGNVTVVSTGTHADRNTRHWSAINTLEQ